LTRYRTPVVLSPPPGGRLLRLGERLSCRRALVLARKLRPGLQQDRAERGGGHGEEAAEYERRVVAAGERGQRAVA
jgi:hypothetical protein